MTDKPTYTRQRAATVRLTQAINEYLDAKYPDGVPWQPIKPEDTPNDNNIDAYLDLFLAIHGDGGTPGMVFSEAEGGVFDWQVVREAARLLKLARTEGHATRLQRLLDNLAASAPHADIDMGEVLSREGGLMENVVYHSCQIAADRFNPDPADPGWNAEMHEDCLRDACLEYVQTFLTRRAHA